MFDTFETLVDFKRIEVDRGQQRPGCGWSIADLPDPAQSEFHVIMAARAGLLVDVFRGDTLVQRLAVAHQHILPIAAIVLLPNPVLVLVPEEAKSLRGHRQYERAILLPV